MVSSWREGATTLDAIAESTRTGSSAALDASAPAGGASPVDQLVDTHVTRLQEGWSNIIESRLTAIEADSARMTASANNYEERERLNAELSGLIPR